MLIDILFILIIGYGFYLGFSERVINTFSLGVLIVLALLLSINLAPVISNFLSPRLNVDGGIVFFLGLLISFFVGVIIIRMLITWFEGIVSKDNVTIAAKLGSGLIMGSLLLVVYGLGIEAVDKISGIDNKVKRESVTYDFARDFPNVAKRSIVSVSPVAKEFWAYVSGNMEDNYRRNERYNKRSRKERRERSY